VYQRFDPKPVVGPELPPIYGPELPPLDWPNLMPHPPGPFNIKKIVPQSPVPIYHWPIIQVAK
jgi:hypothetical protein